MLFFIFNLFLIYAKQKRNPSLFLLVTAQLYTPIDIILKSTYKNYFRFHASLFAILSYAEILLLIILNCFLDQQVLQPNLLKLIQ